MKKYRIVVFWLLIFYAQWWVLFKLMTAVKRAKKKPAIPVEPTSNTSPPMMIGINAKNFSLYAMSNGNRNFLYFFLILNFLPRPSMTVDESGIEQKLIIVNICFDCVIHHAALLATHFTENEIIVLWMGATSALQKKCFRIIASTKHKMLIILANFV